MVLGDHRIQQGFQHLIADSDQTHGLIYEFRVGSGNDGYGIAYKAQVPIQDQPVIGAWFRIGLTGQCESLIRNILPGQNAFDAGQGQCLGCVDFCDEGVSMGTPQKFYHQGILRREVRRIDRLARDQRHGIFFPDGLIQLLHVHLPSLR
ncbi:hypothetical protein SDC9_195647 [bioreactor metagenome]|uniref:Uncharacterized protein n=1 Tax=bioreactor metagenome TaxID=1076179 RepID=A0A645IL38_9ZZZZ